MSESLLSLIAKLAPEKRRLLRAALEEGPEPIAVIGMACRLPGSVRSPEGFWSLLALGRDAIGPLPSERHADPLARSESAASYGGFVDEVYRFDAGFFGIAPREAERMDPQHRHLLEVAWEAFEHAGQPPHELIGSRTGTFIGIMGSDFQLELSAALHAGVELDFNSMIGSGVSFAAGRIANHFGLQGPALSVDTACSSSLAAIHLAVRSLRSGECDLALAGGVSLTLSPAVQALYGQGQLLASDGRCKTFDASADGMGRSEGCAALVLKRISAAQADDDRIWALIRGSSMNHDGPSGGLTVPNAAAQRALIRAALQDARVTPEQIGYIEAHGTGTPLGDPIEWRALQEVFAGRSRETPLYVGSVKTNIGHSVAAAGIAGLIKTVLALHREQIPPHLHLKRLSPHIDLETIPARIPTHTVSWSRSQRPRLAGVSSFGLSGTNVHVVLEEAPAVEPLTDANLAGPCVLPFSARSPAALDALLQRYADLLATEDARRSYRDLCYTAGVRRDHHAHRLALVAETADEARICLTEQHLLQRAASEDVHSGGAAPGVPCKLVFVFAGRDSSQPALSDFGHELREWNAAFRGAFEECEKALRDQPVRSPLQQQFALQVSLARFWASLGIEPDAVVGQGIGELAAAHVAGALSLDDAARVLAAHLSADVTPARIEARSARCAFHSALRGGLTEGPRLDASHFLRALREPASIEDATRAALHESRATLLEIDARSDGIDPRRSLLGSAARLYMAGHDLEWRSLYETPCRIADLPGYPWQGSTFRASLAAVHPSAIPEHQWLYRLSWEASESQAKDGEQERHWIIVGDQQGLALRLREQLEANGATSDWIDPAGTREIASELRRALDACERRCAIAYLAADVTDPVALCSELLHVVQTAGAVAAAVVPRLWIVTRGATDLEGEIRPAQAALWGMGRTIAQEHPELRCSLIDLATDEDSLDGLLRELRAGDDEGQIALRRGRRWVARLEPLPLSGEPIARVLRPDATYLVTGGLGGLGLCMARWLVRQGAKHLVLASRRGISSPEAEMAVRELQELGSQVHVRAVDVSQRDAVRALFDDLRTLPTLRGVVHTAGVAADGALLNLDVESFARVMAPKVQGAWHLHEATLDLPSLDFMIFYSSTASLLGAAGQANYAAANACLDALATLRRHQNLPALAIQWGPWAEVGMAAAAASAGRLRPGVEFAMIQPRQALRVLDILPRVSCAQVAVLPDSLLRGLRHLARVGRSNLFAKLPARTDAESAPQLYPRPELETEYVSPRDPIEVRVAERWQDVLGVERVGVFDNFFALGGNSLLGIQLVAQLSVEFQMDLPRVAVFEAPTVAELARTIATGTSTSNTILDERKERGQRRRARAREASRRVQERREHEAKSGDSKHDTGR